VIHQVDSITVAIPPGQFLPLLFKQPAKVRFAVLFAFLPVRFRAGVKAGFQAGFVGIRRK
jgi:hypothetical protein